MIIRSNTVKLKLFLTNTSEVHRTRVKGILLALSLLAETCHLLTTFANSLDPDQAQQNVGPDLDTKLMSLRLYPCQKQFRSCCGSKIVVPKNFTNTVKPFSNGHLKIDKTKILMENCSLMKVESIAECSFLEHSAILLTCI